MPEKNIIVCYEKHGDYYYDASTPETWAKSSLEILTDRFKEGYWYLTPDEMFPNDSKYGSTVSLVQLMPDFPENGTIDEQKAAIAEYRACNIDVINDPDARALVEGKLKKAVQNFNEKKKYAAWFNELKQIVEDQDAGFVTIGKGKWERQEPKAWRVLSDRSDYEYERVSLETLR